MVMSMLYIFPEDLINSFEVFAENKSANQMAAAKSYEKLRVRFYGDKSTVSISRRSDEQFRSYRLEIVHQSGGCCLIRFS